jgi:hypothetical protein
MATATFDHLPTIPDAGHFWFPCVHTSHILPDGQAVPMAAMSYSRHEVGAAIARALRQGHAVTVWDACPTCASRVFFAAGPASPLACPVRFRRR